MASWLCHPGGPPMAGRPSRRRRAAATGLGAQTTRTECPHRDPESHVRSWSIHQRHHTDEFRGKHSPISEPAALHDLVNRGPSGSHDNRDALTSEA